MNHKLKNTGFSLAEVMMAVGILAVGMLFIAGVFPVGIRLTTIAAERTIAAIVADEAFAKVRLYADPNVYNDVDDIDFDQLYPGELIDFNDNSNDAFPATSELGPEEFTYPSSPNIDVRQRQYYWSALCRKAGADSVQVTVFVSRKTGTNLRYYRPDYNWPDYGRVINWPNPDTIDWPTPVKVKVSQGNRNNELVIDYVDQRERTFINDGYTIVDNETGQIYRVLERYADVEDTILLDRNWQGVNPPASVWVVPPPVNGGRGPCIAVYQRVIAF